MNEKLVFRFVQNGQPLPIDELVPVDLDKGGLMLNGETSAWPRALRFGFQGVGGSKNILNTLRNQVANGKHDFSVGVEDGALTFTTLRPDHIPIGVYEYRLKIADMDIEDSIGQIEVKKKNESVKIRLDVEPESRRVSVANSIHTDKPIADIVNGDSRIDGKKIINWLKDDAPPAQTKSVLAKHIGQA